MEIIIVGAGIAGLGAGIGLRRAGHNVTVSLFCLDRKCTSDWYKDSRTIIVAARSRRSYHNEAECHTGPPVVGLYPRTFQNGFHNHNEPS